MARVHAKDVDFVYAGVALEDELSSVSMRFAVPPADTTAFADTYQTSLAGKPGVTLDVEGSWDPAAGAGDVTIFGDLGGAAQTYDFEPDGTTGYNGYGIVTSYEIVASVDAAVRYTMALQHNGGSAALDGLAPTRA